MKTLFFTYLVIHFSLSYVAAEVPHTMNIESELSSEELGRVNAREFIVKTKDVPGGPWPEITYYALIEASPLQAIGLFSAYDIQKDYIPNLIESRPVKHVTSTDVWTKYELKIPFPLPNAKYVHGAKIFKHQDDYETTWYMVESSSTEAVRGSAYFRAYKGKTLFRYKSFIVPKSIFGSFVKSMMFKDVEKTIKAIANFIEKNKQENSHAILKYSEFITRALNGEFVYQTIIDKK